MFQPQSIGPETTGTPRAPRSRASWHLGRKFEHVVIVLFENQDYDMVLREPYFRDLARRGALFTHYNALFHPSYANYLALIGGKYFGTRGDDQLDIPRTERTIADLLEAKGLTWRQYAEAYPGGCYRGAAASGPLYRRKHVPFLSFDSIATNPSRCARVVPATQFDRKSLPNFAFYSPDMCHDGHDLCSTGFARARDNIRSAPGARGLGVVPPKISQGATWLRGFLEPILADPAVMKDTLVVVTFDESDSDRGRSTRSSATTRAAGFSARRAWRSGRRTVVPDQPARNSWPYIHTRKVDLTCVNYCHVSSTVSATYGATTVGGTGLHPGARCVLRPWPSSL